jgi:hypothetical protein
MQHGMEAQLTIGQSEKPEIYSALSSDFYRQILPVSYLLICSPTGVQATSQDYLSNNQEETYFLPSCFLCKERGELVAF